MTALGVALAQRGELAKAVASGAATPKQAQDVVKQTMARFKQPDVAATGVQIPPTASLTDAVNRLADRLVQLNQEKTQLAQALETANKEKQDSIAGRDALLKQKDDQIAVVTKQVQ